MKQSLSKDKGEITLNLNQIVSKVAESPSEEGKEHDCTRYAKINCSCKNGECKHEEAMMSFNYVERIKELQSRLQELEKSDQDALANAWEEGMKAGHGYHYLDYLGTIKPKNPYTKD